MSPSTARFPVAEIFGPTIQGEGKHAGRLCHFIRFGGCDYRCSWCDSMHAVEPEKVRGLDRLMVEEIMDHLLALGPVNYVVITGGNPALYDLSKLILELQDHNIFVAVETQGTVFSNWLVLADLVTISPKPPSSGMPDTLADGRLLRFISNFWPTNQTVLKVVVFDDNDLEWANKVAEATLTEDFYLSVGTELGNHQPPYLLSGWRWLIQEISSGRYQHLMDANILCQLHVLLWGDKLGV